MFRLNLPPTHSREPAVNGPPPGVVLAQAHRLLVDTFSRHELRLLLLEKLAVRLYEIARPDTDDSSLCLDVVAWFDRRGRLNALIREASAARPGVPEWQAVLTGLRLSREEQQIRTYQLLTGSFSRDELRLLLRTQMGERLEQITTPWEDDSAAALTVVEWFDRQGRLCELIRAAALARRQVPGWTPLHNINCPPPPV